MVHAIRHRIVTVALAALAGLVVAASPAAATDDPAPPPAPAPQGGAPSVGAPVPAPSVSHRKQRAGKRRVRVHVRYRKHRKGVRVSLSGPGMTGVKRVEVFVHGRRIARDATRPFRLVIGGRRLGGSRKLQIRLVGQSGVRKITRRLRGNRSAHRSVFQSIAASISLNPLLSRYGVV